MRDESPLPFVWPGTGIVRSSGAPSARTISIRQTGAAVVITVPVKSIENADVSLLTLQGKAMACPLERKGPISVLRTAAAGKGIYFVKVKAAGNEATKKIIVLR